MRPEFRPGWSRWREPGARGRRLRVSLSRPPVDPQLGGVGGTRCQPGDDGLTTAERRELSHLRPENRQLRLEREILSKGGGQVRLGDDCDSTEGFRFVSDHQAGYPLATVCRAAGCLSQPIRLRATAPCNGRRSRLPSQAPAALAAVKDAPRSLRWSPAAILDAAACGHWKRGGPDALSSAIVTQILTLHESEVGPVAPLAAYQAAV